MYIVCFVMVLRVILIDFFTFIEMECPFQLVHTEVYSPFLTIDKHIERFYDVKFPSSKETQLQSTFSPRRRVVTSVASSVRSMYPALCTCMRSLSSFDCCSSVKFPKCLPQINFPRQLLRRLFTLVLGRDLLILNFDSAIKQSDNPLPQRKRQENVPS